MNDNILYYNTLNWTVCENKNIFFSSSSFFLQTFKWSIEQLPLVLGFQVFNKNFYIFIFASSFFFYLQSMPIYIFSRSYIGKYFMDYVYLFVVKAKNKYILSRSNVLYFYINDSKRWIVVFLFGLIFSFLTKHKYF